MLATAPIVLPATVLDEIRAYLRIDPAADDPSFAALAMAAMGHAEAFVSQLLIRRDATERLTATGQWQRLAARPVAAITSVTGIPAEGAGFPLSPDAYAIDIDASGDGWVRVVQPGSAGRVDIVYQAGLAASWDVLPEAVRLGVMRLVGHLYAYRDDNDDRGPPAAVAALLRPWRRIRL